MQRHRAGEQGPAGGGRTIRAGVAGAVLSVLGGCAWFGQDDPPEMAPVCPAAVPLDGAQRTTAFAPGVERSAASIRWVAAINQVRARCRSVEGVVELELRFAVVAEAGPAFAGEPVVLELFVALLDQDQLIRSRHPFAVRLELDPAARRAGRMETLTFDLPPPGPDAAVDRAYVGFQLDRPQVQERLRRLRR